MLVLDPRLDQVKKIVESLVTKSLLYSTDCLVTSDNNLVLVVDDTLMYLIPLKNEIMYPTIGFSYAKFMEVAGDRDIDFSKTSIDIFDIMIVNRISTLYSGYNNIMNNTAIVAYNDDLKNTENFSNYLSIRAEDGMKYYRLPGIVPGTQYHIPIFTGFPNVSAQDKLGIYVYDITNGFLLTKFKIFKKKINRDIDILFRIINLTGGRRYGS